MDGLNTYEAVEHDFVTWKPRLSRAIVLFHDIAVGERDFGVWRFWNGFNANYQSLEFDSGHGLGVLAIGRVDGLMKRLFDLKPVSCERI